MKIKQVGYPVRLRPQAFERVRQVADSSGSTPGKTASMLVLLGWEATFGGRAGARKVSAVRELFASGGVSRVLDDAGGVK